MNSMAVQAHVLCPRTGAQLAVYLRFRYMPHVKKAEVSLVRQRLVAYKKQGREQYRYYSKRVCVNFKFSGDHHSVLLYS